MHLQTAAVSAQGIVVPHPPLPFSLHLKIPGLFSSVDSTMNPPQSGLGLFNHFKHYVFFNPAHQLDTNIFSPQQVLSI